MFTNTNTKKVNVTIWALIVFIIAFFARLHYNQETIIINPIRADAANYYTYATNLIEHGVFSKQRETDTPAPDAYWAPGYPAFLAIIMTISSLESWYDNALSAQALIGALTAVLTLLLGMMFLPLWGALAASILTSLSPHSLSLGSYILSETLFSFLIILTIYLFSLLMKKKCNEISLSIAAGVVAGLCYLTNPVFFFAPFILLAIALFTQKITRKDQRLALGLFIIAFLVLSTGWGLRNAINVSDESPSSIDRALTNFIIGSHPDFYDIYRDNPRNPNNPATLDEKRVDGSWKDFISLLSARITESPLLYAQWYLIKKPLLLWGWNILVGQGDIYVYPVVTSPFLVQTPAIIFISLMGALHPILLGFLLIGLFMSLKNLKNNSNPSSCLIVFSILLYISLVYILLQSEARYSIPLRPEFYLGAVFGIWQISKLINGHVKKNRA